MSQELNSIVKSLILKARESNQAAFEELLKLYSPLITSFVNRFAANNITDQDAEDLRQELTMVFYNSILSFDVEQNEVSFGLYTKICLNNAFVTQLRTLNKRSEAAATTLQYDDEIEGVAQEQKSPEHELIEREKMKEINGKIEKMLSPFENSVWRMYVAGCSTREMAHSFGKSEKSIDNAVFRIRRKLKNMFSK